MGVLRILVSITIFLGLSVFLVSPVSAAGSELVNTTTEWKNGDFDSVRASSGQIFLDSDVPSLDWNQTDFDERVEEVIVEGDFVYAASGQNVDGGYIAKMWRENGSFVWKVQKSGSNNRWTSLELGPSENLFALEYKEGIYKLDKDGNFDNSGSYPLNRSIGRKYDIEQESGYIYKTGGYGDIWKWEISSGNFIERKDFDTFARELEVYNESRIILGAAYDAYLVKIPSLTLINSQSGFGGSIDAIERGPDDNIWFGDNDGIFKYDLSLRNELCRKMDYVSEVPAMASDFSGIFSATHHVEKFNRLNSSCKPVWKEDPAPKGYESMVSDGRAVYLGAGNISGGVDGSVDKYFEEFESEGGYKSVDFDWSGDTKYLDNVKVNSDLKAEKANLTVIWSDTTNFNPSSTSKKTIELNKGIDNYNLPLKPAKKVKFHANLTSISREDTPRIKSVKLNYLDNTPPQINAVSPTGSGESIGTKTLEVNVSDADGDNMKVYFYAEGSYQDTVAISGSGNATETFNAPNYGTTYNWRVNISDGKVNTSKSYSFTTVSNPKPQINDYSPPNSTYLDKDKIGQNISVEVSDPNTDDMDITFYNDTGDQIDSVQTVTGGSGKAWVNYTGLSEGNRYDWTVEVTDGVSTVIEEHHFFTEADQLPVIDNPDPTNGTGVLPREVNVSVDVEDPDGDDTIVEIYNETGNIHGERLASGGLESVNASYNAPNYGQNYEWTVVAYRNGTPSKKTTKIYNFDTVTNPEPVVTDYFPPNGTKMKPGNSGDANGERNVTIDDPNDDSPIDVTFYEGSLSAGDKIGSDQVTGGYGTASVSDPFAGSGTSEEWYVVIDDGANTVTKVYNYNTSADSAPTFSKVSPKDNVTITASPADLSVLVKDDFSSEIDIRFEDDDGNEIKNGKVDSGDYANASYNVMTDERSYNWTIIAEDSNSHTNTSEFRFYYYRPPFRPVQASIESNYTDIIMTESSSTIVPFRITNPSAKKNLRVSIQEGVEEVNARFLDGSTSKDIIMDQGTQTFLVEVSPDSPGQKEISLDVENLNYGTTVTDTKNVFVEESSSSREQVNVPGIGIVQIYSLLMISTLAYFALL